ncbi:MAG: DUF6042 family protein, partial [Andreesenia angusta]|nr:DUF6042 family protein [Andreesenia angusta]
MKVKIPINIGKHLWTRYLPDTSYKTYAYILYLNQIESDARDLKKELLEANLGKDESLPQVIEEKKRVLENIGLKFPESRKEDLELLEKFKLIESDENSKSGYKALEDIKRPEEVLNLDEEEKKALEDIRFEMNYANQING